MVSSALEEEVKGEVVTCNDREEKLVVEEMSKGSLLRFLMAN